MRQHVLWVLHATSHRGIGHHWTMQFCTIPIYIQYLVVFEKLNLVFVEVLSVQNFIAIHTSISVISI